MKKILISMAISVFIMLIIPLLIVSFVKPHNNAISTEPIAPTEAVDKTGV